MAVPIATIAKKVATTILFSDKENRDRFLIIAGSIIVGPFIPILVVILMFTSGFDTDSVTNDAQNNANIQYIGESINNGIASTVINPESFADINSKNNYDLVRWAWMAYTNNWGYVWGTYGNVLTRNSLDSLAQIYPDNVGDERHYSYIFSNYLGRRTVDCVGLIKSYMWFDFNESRFIYGSNNFSDYNTERLFQAATDGGPIETMPEVPGIVVYHKGHVGIYVGEGQVIEAMGTSYGVVLTSINSGGWTNWFYVPGLNYT